MKVLLISSGAGSWPNNGWGAVENLVADFAWALQQEGSEVSILHQPNPEYVIEQRIAEFKPDIVHLEFDDHLLCVLPVLQHHPEIKVLITQHYAMLSQPYKLVQDGYMNRFLFSCDIVRKSSATFAVLSKEIANTFVELGNVPAEKIWIFPNGTRTDKIRCLDASVHTERAICLGKIEVRKNQVALQQCPFIDFVGPITDDRFIKTLSYKGHWTRDEMYSRLTEYPCLTLISKAEAHPLVIGEALAAGCAILCNEISAANLPRDVPWIRIVPDSILDTPDVLTRTIQEMCAIGCQNRKEIRTWAEKHLDWRMRARSYLDRWLPGQRIVKTAVINSDSLRIALIGPGIMPIPPPGWGAVEQVIWDYAVLLRKKGYSVDIINTPKREEIIEKVSQGNYDIAHLHYDVFADILPTLQSKAKAVLVTSHYPYIHKQERWAQDNYKATFDNLCEAVKRGIKLFCISQKDLETFREIGGLRNGLYLMKNGVHTELFEMKQSPHFAGRTVCLAKIEKRKRQHLTWWCNQVDYIGKGEFGHPNFRGEIGHDILYKLLTDYGNLVLLSESENGTPLVVKEAMAAGLGCILSESAAVELDQGLPWITRIPEEKLADTVYVNQAIEQNRMTCRSMRELIRNYTKDTWDWDKLLDQYIENVQSIIGEK